MNARPRICHVLFQSLMRLPVMAYEIGSLGREWDLHVVLPAYAQDEEEARARFPEARFHFVPVALRRWDDSQRPFFKLLRYLEFVARAAAAVIRIRPAIAVGHDLAAMLPAFPARLLTGARIVYNAHEIWSEAAAENAPLRPLWHAVERAVVRRSDAVITPEPNRARILRDEYGARRLPFVAANIPPVSESYGPGIALRERLGIGDDAVVVIYQGLMAESRCILELLDAVAALPERFHLVLIGGAPGEYASRVRERAARSGIAARVRFIEWVPYHELAALTASADVGVLLYRNEGRNNYYAAPNKLYEYLHAGLPVVASDFPGLRAVVDGGEFGALADPASSASIRKAIEEAAAHPKGAAIAEKARALYRWEDQADVLRRLYASMLQRNGRTG